jgi:hypothetical protein
VLSHEKSFTNFERRNNGLNCFLNMNYDNDRKKKVRKRIQFHSLLYDQFFNIDPILLLFVSDWIKGRGIVGLG